MENGYTRIPNSIILSKNLKVYEKMVLVVLISYRMDKDECYPTREQISKNAGVDIKTVDNAIKLLTNKKFITPYKKGRKSFYKINKFLKIKEEKKAF